jgi:hypothetical protein
LNSKERRKNGEWRRFVVQGGGGFSLAGGLLGGGAAVSPVQALDSFLPLVVR